MNQHLAAWLGIPVVFMLAACNGAQPQGRFYSVETRGSWIEFGNGVVVHGDTGDVSQYRLDGAKIIVSDRPGTVEGEIVGPATVRFQGGTGPVADAFAGVWVARAESGPVLGTAEAEEAAGAIVGQWRIPGETHVFDLRADGTYTWGPRLGGSYEMLAGSRVRMTTTEDGRSIGTLDYDYAVDGARLTLTFPDGSAMTYERVE